MVQNKKIYIYGASGHGLVVADIARSNGYQVIEFIDDGDNKYLDFEVIKDNNHIPIALGVGSNKIREKLFNKVLKHNFQVVSLIHSSAIISSSVRVGLGTVVMPNVVVNAKSKIGKCVILNTSAVIEHENIIEDFVHISPHVSLAGEVRVKNSTHIGIGTSVIQGLTIGSHCIIGAGSVVVESIEDNRLCFGNPCKVKKEIV